MWATYNRHLARVMAATPEEVLTRVHTRHNLDAISFRASTRPHDVTLACFMEDYVAHLAQDLQQILGADGRLARVSARGDPR